MKTITEAHIQKWLQEVLAKTHPKMKRALVPFSGKYPTRVYFHIQGQNHHRKPMDVKYFGKPSFNAYQRLRAAFREFYQGPYVVLEVDRTGILFSEGTVEKQRAFFVHPSWATAHPGAASDVYTSWMGGKRFNKSVPGSGFYGKKEAF